MQKGEIVDKLIFEPWVKSIQFDKSPSWVLFQYDEYVFVAPNIPLRK